MAERVLTCPHCSTTNVVAQCCRCDRWFVVTLAALEDRIRDFDDVAIAVAPGTELLCDFDAAKDRGETSVAAVNAGLRQNTCPACHTAFIDKGELSP